MTIIEGNPATMIGITLSLTAEYYCAMKFATACSFEFLGHVTKTNEQLTCLDSSIVPDLVIVSGGSSLATAKCGSDVSGSATSVTLGVKAVNDLKYQGDRNRIADITWNVIVNGATTTTNLLKKINVRIILCIFMYSKTSLCHLRANKYLMIDYLI